jgi:hypothetical protein
MRNDTVGLKKKGKKSKKVIPKVELEVILGPLR